MTKKQIKNFNNIELEQANRLAKLIRDIDKGVRVSPEEKALLYSLPSKIRYKALDLNKEFYQKRRW